MAVNTKYELGAQLQFNVGTGVKSGDPVVIGSIPGVAQADADANGYAPVKMLGVVSLSVKGIDGVGNSAVNVGDAIYFVSADTPHLSKKNSGTLFGYAYSETVAGGSQLIAGGATATISVLLHRV